MIQQVLKWNAANRHAQLVHVSDVPRPARAKVSSGKGVAHAYPAHLHFEIKLVGSLGTLKPDGTGIEYGYTHQLPTARGYIDPSSLLDGPWKNSPRRIIKVIGRNRKSEGPREDYPPGVAETGKLFIAINDSPSTSQCSHGWVQIVKTERDVSDVTPKDALTTYFPKGALSTGGLNPDAWLCKGHDDRITNPSDPNATDQPWVLDFRSGDVDGSNDGIVDQRDVDAIWKRIFIIKDNGKCRKSFPAGPTDVYDLNGDLMNDWADVELAYRLCSPSCALPKPRCP